MPTAAQLAARRRLVAAAQKRHAPRKIPRALQPTGPTLALTAPLLAIAADLDAAVNDALAAEGLDALRTDAADGDLPRFNRGDLLARIKRLAAAIVKRRGTFLDDALVKVGDAVSAFSKEQFARQAKAAMGVDLSVVEPNLAPAIKAFRQQHVDLIKTMTSAKVDRVRAILEDAGASARVETIRNRLMEDLGVTKRQAALIARDQVLKLNSAVTQKRHEAAGATEYIWRTSGDASVRPEHRALNGKVFTYDDPPVVAKNGDRARPGEYFQCRCTMEPYFEGLDEAPVEEAPAPTKPPPRIQFHDPPPAPLPKHEFIAERSYRALPNDRHDSFDAMPVAPKLQGVSILDHKVVEVNYPFNRIGDAAFNEHLVEATRAAITDVPPAHIKAVDDYTGADYQRANLLLRAGPAAVEAKYGKAAVDAAKRVTAGTIEALKVLPRAPSDMTLFRGAAFRDPVEGAKHLDALARGTEFTADSFLSTSRDPAVALGFGGGEFTDNPSVLYRFRKHKTAAILSPEFSIGAEAEVLFPPGARFKIVGRQRISATQLVVDVEEV